MSFEKDITALKKNLVDQGYPEGELPATPVIMVEAESIYAHTLSHIVTHLFYKLGITEMKLSCAEMNELVDGLKEKSAISVIQPYHEGNSNEESGYRIRILTSGDDNAVPISVNRDSVMGQMLHYKKATVWGGEKPQ